jgi:hypothetical protein
MVIDRIKTDLFPEKDIFLKLNPSKTGLVFKFQPFKTDPETRSDAQIQTIELPQEDGQVVVHIHFFAFPGALIRVWPNTFLIPEDTGYAKIVLVHSENITLAPVWTRLQGYGIFSFSLIFGALPRSCALFSLVEEIEEKGAFHFKDIARNSSDVYHLWI